MDLKTYLSKLNDRNLQRKRESGFTTYALYSVLVLIMWKLLDSYRTIPLREDIFLVCNIMMYTLNLGISLISIYGVYQISSGHDSPVRIRKINSRKLFLDTTLEYSILVLPLSFTLLITIRDFISSSYNLYGIIYSIVLILFLILSYKINSESKKLNNTFEIFKGTGKAQNDRDIFSIIFYTVSIATIIFSLYGIFTLKCNVKKTEIFLFGILLYTLPCVIIKILNLRNQDHFTNALENLEYEVHLKNIDEHELKQKLQNYYGYALQDWIVYNLQLVDDFEKYVQKEINELSNLLTNLSTLKTDFNDNAYKNLYIQATIKKYTIETYIKDFFNTKFLEIQNISNQSQIETSDRQELSKLLTVYKTKHKQYSNQLKLE